MTIRESESDWERERRAGVMIVGHTCHYRLDRSDRLPKPVGPFRPKPDFKIQTGDSDA